jgi:hypothetical protein
VKTDQKSADADVRVEVWPVDTFAVADETPTATLARRSIEKGGEPSQRNQHAASVDKVDNEFGVGDLDAIGKGLKSFG